MRLFQLLLRLDADAQRNPQHLFKRIAQLVRIMLADNFFLEIGFDMHHDLAVLDGVGLDAGNPHLISDIADVVPGCGDIPECPTKLP